MKATNSVYTGLPTTIFEEMSRLAMAQVCIQGKNAHLSNLA